MMGNSSGSGGMMGNSSGYGGMMGNISGTNTSATATTDMPIKKADARDRAQKFLDKQFPGAVAGEPDTFYGYYTVFVDKDRLALGMLSVDGYYGQVVWHSWTGAVLGTRNFQ